MVELQCNGKYYFLSALDLCWKVPFVELSSTQCEPCVKYS